LLAGTALILACRLLHHGDTIRIKPATVIPTDGIIACGVSSVEESYVTGESVPVLKKPGDLVRAGTLNLDGILDVEITSLVHENSLAKVTALVNHAQAARSRYQDLADRLSAIVLPVATVAALASFLIWLLVNRFIRGRSWADSSVDAISYAIAIMAMSCPCALGLAVPTIVSAITRVGIREGVFYRSADALQRGHDIAVVAFDKTGTLSQGTFTVVECHVIIPQVRQLVLGITSSNAHPVSLAVAANLEAQGVGKPLVPDDLVTIPGSGVSATFRGYPLLAGSPHYTKMGQHPLVAAYVAAGLTVLTVTLGHQLVAAYGLADRPRAESEQLILTLTAQGKQVIMLSGDNPGAVRSFADAINLPYSMTRDSCSPVDKASIITSYQQQGHKVCFVGDGTNDSIAMSTADLSFSLIAGSEIAKASSDVILLGTDLKRNVLSALSAAQIFRLHVVLAITWCVIYAVFAILLASGATVQFRIAPQWAGLGEVISILPIIVIAAAVPLTWKVRKACA
jgi:Cu2+-exporting ATPase